MQLGTTGMHNQVRQWANQPYLMNLFNLLLDYNFQIYLTSDHGNIEANGCGRPSEGSLADLRGERVRIYSDAILRSNIKDKISGTFEWPCTGLPENYLALIAPNRQAFVQKDESIVSHGGIAIEEVIVPFIKIERDI
jgi:hypothetical protein